MKWEALEKIWDNYTTFSIYKTIFINYPNIEWIKEKLNKLKEIIYKEYNYTSSDIDVPSFIRKPFNEI